MAHHAMDYRLLLVSLFLATAAAKTCIAAEPGTAWKQGPEFDRQLRSRVGFTLSGSPIRESLEQLGQRHGIAIFLDRRIDPGALLSVEVSGLPLLEALGTVAAQQGASAGVVDSVVYIGPPETANAIATVAALNRQKIERVPEHQRKKLQVRGGWQWEDLTTPKDLLRELCSEAGIRIDPAPLPHDLWAGMTLPRLPLVDRLSLLLAGFGLTIDFAADGERARFVSFPTAAKFNRRYAANHPRLRNVAALREQFPELQFRRQGRQLEVVGSFEQHEELAAYLRGRRRSPQTQNPEQGVRVQYLKVENQPVGAVLKSLATQARLEVELSSAIADRLTQRISIELKEATIEESLVATLEPAGLAYELRGRHLRVFLKQGQ